MKNVLKMLIPPILFAWRQNSNIFGRYSSFEDALRASGGEGYSAGNEHLVRRVKGIRDSQEPPAVWAWTTLSAVMLSAVLRSDQRLRVIDWGGGYGETCFVFREFLKEIPCIEWNIVEIQGKVLVGRREFETSLLKFYTSIEEIDSIDTACLLLGGVLQYLDDPYSEVAPFV